MAIAGIAVSSGRPPDERELESMLATLAVKNTWSRECLIAPQAGFGATWYPARDASWQDNAILVVCDADIFNQEELFAKVALPAENSNLARLLALLFLKDGPDFIGTLRGAFSIAIWDSRTATLLLAVDRFGVKPLCFAASSSEVAFGSHPRAILAGGRVPRQVDLEAIVNYLTYSVVPAPLCAFKGIHKLPPATLLTWRDGVVRESRYWDLNYEEDRRAPATHLADELLLRMEEAVEHTSRNVSGSDLGCFLSGGTDSSSVVGLLTRIRKSPVNTVSVSFAEERFNELDYVHIAAREFATAHADFRLGPAEAFHILPRIVSLYDEPFGNASVIPTYFCQENAARRGIHVLLAGDGGDELFGGNEHYRTDQIHQIYHRIPAAFRRGVLEPLASLIPSRTPAFGKIRRYVDSSNLPNPERCFRWIPMLSFSPQEILDPGMPFHNGHGDLLSVARSHFRSARASSELNRLLYLDVKMVLGDSDLPKVVRASELAGVSVRFPYLDHALAEFSARIPANLKLRGLEKRYLFKLATRSLLPKATLQKKKHGFGLPIGLWLKSDPLFRQLAGDVLLDPRTYQRGYFRQDFIESLFGKMASDDTPYYGDLLYSFLILELWHREHLESAPQASHQRITPRLHLVLSSSDTDRRRVDHDQSKIAPPPL